MSDTVRIHSGKRALRYNPHHGAGGKFTTGDGGAPDRSSFESCMKAAKADVPWSGYLTTTEQADHLKEAGVEPKLAQAMAEQAQALNFQYDPGLPLTFTSEGPSYGFGTLRNERSGDDFAVTTGKGYVDVDAGSVAKMGLAYEANSGSPGPMGEGWTSTDGVEGLTTHEFAHVLLNNDMSGVLRAQATAAAYSAGLPRPTADDREYALSQLSGYAAKDIGNRDEIIAEAFAAYKDGNVPGSDIPWVQAIGTTIDAHFGVPGTGLPPVVVPDFGS